MMKKRYILVSAFLAGILSLSACGGGNNSADTANGQSSVDQTAANAEGVSANTSAAVSSDPTAGLPVCDISSISRFSMPVLDGDHFWRITPQSDEIFTVGMTGEVLADIKFDVLNTKSLEHIGSIFLAITKGSRADSSDQYTIYDRNGNVLMSNEKDGFDGILDVSDNYLLVYKNEDGIKTGVYDIAGNSWIHPLGSTPKLETYTPAADGNWILYKDTVSGANDSVPCICYQMVEDRTHEICYIVYDYVKDEIVQEIRCSDIKDNFFNIYITEDAVYGQYNSDTTSNGYSLRKYVRGSDKPEIIINLLKGECAYYVPGDAWAVASNGGSNIRVYDLDGKNMIELKNYDFSSYQTPTEYSEVLREADLTSYLRSDFVVPTQYMRYDNGRILFLLCNEQNGRTDIYYYGADTTGELFGPIAVQDTSLTRNMLNVGSLSINEDGVELYNKTVFDLNGKEIEKTSMVKEDIELEEGQKAYYVENGNGDYYVIRNLTPDEEDMKKRIYIMIYYKADGTPVMIFTDKPDEYRSIISEEKKGEEASQDTGEGEQSGDQEQPGTDDKAYTVKNYSLHNGALTFTTKDNKHLELNPDGSAVECNRSFSTDILRWSSNERELIDKEGNVLASPELNGYTSIVGFTSDHILVCTRETGMSGDKIQLGTLDKNGNWVIPLHDDSPLMEYISMIDEENFNRSPADKSNHVVITERIEGSYACFNLYDKSGDKKKGKGFVIYDFSKDTIISVYEEDGFDFDLFTDWYYDGYNFYFYNLNHTKLCDKTGLYAYSIRLAKPEPVLYGNISFLNNYYYTYSDIKTRYIDRDWVYAIYPRFVNRDDSNSEEEELPEGFYDLSGRPMVPISIEGFYPEIGFNCIVKDDKVYCFNYTGDLYCLGLDGKNMCDPINIPSENESGKGLCYRVFSDKGIVYQYTDDMFFTILDLDGNKKKVETNGCLEIYDPTSGMYITHESFDNGSGGSAGEKSYVYNADNDLICIFEK